MILWIVLTVMTAVAAAGLAIPLVRRHETSRARDSVVSVLEAELRDIDAQAARGDVGAQDAEGLRTEVKRRILAEGRGSAPESAPLSERSLVFVALGLVAMVALGATLLYARMGRPDLAHRPDAATATAPDAAGAGHPGADVASMIDQLERRMAQAPGDPEGWRMLGWSYFQTGRYGDAATAYGRAVALDPTNAEYLSAQGESLMRAAGGQITPGAVAVFRKAMAADPTDPRARYFLAAYKDQQGDHKGAMDDWIALLKSAPADAPWAAEVRAFVEQQAQARGEDISGRLPPQNAPAQTAGPAPTTPGPSQDQVAAAAQMSGAERQAMIAGMVDRLEAQLKASPRDEDGWVRLMRARMVLGQAAAASAAYRESQRAFDGAPAEQAALRGAAQGLGVPGV